MIRIAVVIALLFAAGPAFAQERGTGPFTAADRQEIATAILGQMAAFKAENGAAAFAFSASNVREKFGSPETFMRMIREKYQPVYNPRWVRFGVLHLSHVGPVQHVSVLDSNAVAFVALYLMKRGADGRWRIAGCFLRQREALET